MNSTTLNQSLTASRISKANELCELLADIVREFILHPLDLSVAWDSPEKILEGNAPAHVNIRITCQAGDVRRIIGSKGAHFIALSRLCHAFGVKNGMQIELRHLVKPSGLMDRYNEFKLREDWPKARILDLLARTAKAVFKDEEAIIVECKDGVEDSTILIHVSTGENLRMTLYHLHPAFKVLGNAIGKSNGHTLIVLVINDADPVFQPGEAGGRYAKELAR